MISYILALATGRRELSVTKLRRPQGEAGLEKGKHQEFHFEHVNLTEPIDVVFRL